MADNPVTHSPRASWSTGVWQGHFGEALVRTPNNWGNTGEKPTHPELLDYLAKRFIQDGWSIKAMHRLILLSSTYQMSGRSAEVRERIPVIVCGRDSIASACRSSRSGTACWRSTERSIQPWAAPCLSRGKRPKIEFDEHEAADPLPAVRRGSIPNLLATFDFGDATTSNEGRPRTNVAPQALFMMNSRFAVERSSGLAKKLLDAPLPSDTERVTRAYRAVLTRSPESREVDAALAYVAELEAACSADADAHAARGRASATCSYPRTNFSISNKP